MAMPTPFGQIVEPAVASYNWEDIAAGTGYRTYYFLKNDDSTSSALYSLVPQQIESYTIFTAWSTVNAPISMRGEIDFDYTFKVPGFVRGRLFISDVIGLNDKDVGYSIFKIYHVNTAATETLLATIQTATRTNLSGSAQLYRQTEYADITGQKFGVGETLRITQEVWAYKSTAGTGQVTIWHDPAGRTYTATDTQGFALNIQSKVEVPFRIDL